MVDPAVTASLLADVLENFKGRHRNLLQEFEFRADEMEQALAAHGAFSSVQRQLIGAYFLNEYSLRPLHCSIPASCRILTSRVRRKEACASFSVSGPLAKGTCLR